MLGFGTIEVSLEAAVIVTVCPVSNGPAETPVTDTFCAAASSLTVWLAIASKLGGSLTRTGWSGSGPGLVVAARGRVGSGDDRAVLRSSRAAALVPACSAVVAT